jgi:cell division protein FtsB
MAAGRRADSARRRQRVVTALDQAVKSGEEISVSGIARRAGVDRAFLYRHRDLLERVHAAEAQPPAGPASGALVSRESLQADLANAQARNNRLDVRVRQLEKKLSEFLGEQAWRESGLGAPEDIDALKRRITELEQSVVDLSGHLEERTEELAAARAANREMITRLNSST